MYANATNTDQHQPAPTPNVSAAAAKKLLIEVLQLGKKGRWIFDLHLHQVLFQPHLLAARCCHGRSCLRRLQKQCLAAVVVQSTQLHTLAVSGDIDRFQLAAGHLASFRQPKCWCSPRPLSISCWSPLSIWWSPPSISWSPLSTSWSRWSRQSTSWSRWSRQCMCWSHWRWCIRWSRWSPCSTDWLQLCIIHGGLVTVQGLLCPSPASKVNKISNPTQLSIRLSNVMVLQFMHCLHWPTPDACRCLPGQNWQNMFCDHYCTAIIPPPKHDDKDKRLQVTRPKACWHQLTCIHCPQSKSTVHSQSFKFLYVIYTLTLTLYLSLSLPVIIVV